MTDDDLKSSIKAEEGLKLDVYRDSLGNLTVGYGHLVRCGSKITQAAADSLFEADFKKAVTGYGTLGLKLDPVRRAAIIDMIFNMGIGNVQQFKRMITHLKDRSWVQAAYELMESEYAKQVPARAKRNRDRILRGDR
jgi:lysozyme